MAGPKDKGEVGGPDQGTATLTKTAVAGSGGLLGIELASYLHVTDSLSK